VLFRNPEQYTQREIDRANIGAGILFNFLAHKSDYSLKQKIRNFSKDEKVLLIEFITDIESDNKFWHGRIKPMLMDANRFSSSQSEFGSSTRATKHSKFQKIKAALPPLEQLVERYAPLTKAGHDKLKAMCPIGNHDRKSPSFVIYLNTQSFHCFGCKKSGDNISFIRLMTEAGLWQKKVAV